MRGADTATRARRGSLASCCRSVASWARSRCSTRSRRWSAISRSVVQELDPLLAELGELEVVDETHHLTQAAIDVRLIGSDLAHAEDRALPEVVVLAFRDRDVELLLHPRLDRPQHAPLALERVGLRQPELEAEDADDHRRSAPRPIARLPARPSPT